jgi:hypothetical protein
MFFNIDQTSQVRSTGSPQGIKVSFLLIEINIPFFRVIGSHSVAYSIGKINFLFPKTALKGKISFFDLGLNMILTCAL